MTWKSIIRIVYKDQSFSVVSGELLEYVRWYINSKYTKILEVNLFAFAYRLFHEDFCPINSKYVYLPGSIFNVLFACVYIYVYTLPNLCSSWALYQVSWVETL